MREDWTILGRHREENYTYYLSRCKKCNAPESEKFRNAAHLRNSSCCRSCSDKEAKGKPKQRSQREIEYVPGTIAAKREEQLTANPYLPERLGSRTVQRIRCCRQKTCQQCAGDGYYLEMQKVHRTARGKAALYEGRAP